MRGLDSAMIRVRIEGESDSAELAFDLLLQGFNILEAGKSDNGNRARLTLTLEKKTTAAESSGSPKQF